MKNRVIVFGMGGTYSLYKEKINSMYEVIGYVSNNMSEKQSFHPYYNINQITDVDFDLIIVCSVDELDILNQLVNSGISMSRIVLMRSMSYKAFSYAQYGEDIVLLFLLREMGLEYQNIKYIELGTSHPFIINNTYALYKQGARGILVEPCKKMYNMIEMFRPEDTLIKAAININEGESDYYELETQELGTIIYDNLDKNYCENNHDFTIKNRYRVPTKTINQVFELIDGQVDLLSIDIEGLDYLVLLSLDWNRFRPRIIVAELLAAGVKEQMTNKIMNLLHEKNYVLIRRYMDNAIFVRMEDITNIKKYID